MSNGQNEWITKVVGSGHGMFKKKCENIRNRQGTTHLFLHIAWKYKPSQPIGDHTLWPCPLRVVSNYIFNFVRHWYGLTFVAIDWKYHTRQKSSFFLWVYVWQCFLFAYLIFDSHRNGDRTNRKTKRMIGKKKCCFHKRHNPMWTPFQAWEAVQEIVKLYLSLQRYL